MKTILILYFIVSIQGMMKAYVSISNILDLYINNAYFAGFSCQSFSCKLWTKARQRADRRVYFLSKHKTGEKITEVSPTIHNKVNQACLETTEASVDV